MSFFIKMQESLIISFIRARKKRFSIAAMFWPPHYHLKKENYLKFLKSLGEKFIVGGEFNAKNR